MSSRISNVITEYFTEEEDADIKCKSLRKFP